MNHKQEAENRVKEFDLPSGLMTKERVQCALIAINREVKFIENMRLDLGENLEMNASNYLFFKLGSLEKTKDELLKI